MFEEKTRGKRDHLLLQEVDECKKLWLDGASSYTIARQYNCSPQAIRVWTKKWAKEIRKDAHPNTAPMFWKHELRRRFGPPYAAWRPLPEFLCHIELGMTTEAVCDLFGWDKGEYEEYHRLFPQFAVVIKMAEQRFHLRLLKKMNQTAERDGRVAMALLEKNRATKEDYKDVASEQVIRVETNYSRGTAIPAPYIDVTPKE